MDNIEIVDLCKNVTVYKNAYKLSKELIDAFHNAPVGNGQYVLSMEDAYHDFGRKRRVRNSEVDYTARTYEGHPPMEDDIAFDPVAALLQTYDECLKDFQARHAVTLEVDRMTELEVRFYEPGQGCGYHSDYQGYRPPGVTDFPIGYNYPNYSITLNCYLNSDYEGGELQFKLNNETESIPYQPREGDVILFPSGYPYQHRISKVEKNRRWFTNFMLIEQQLPTWHFTLNEGPTVYEFFKDHVDVLDSAGE